MFLYLERMHKVTESRAGKFFWKSALHCFVIKLERSRAYGGQWKGL